MKYILLAMSYATVACFYLAAAFHVHLVVIDLLVVWAYFYLAWYHVDKAIAP